MKTKVTHQIEALDAVGFLPDLECLSEGYVLETFFVPRNENNRDTNYLFSISKRMDDMPFSTQ